jgi:hypothetical protein
MCSCALLSGTCNYRSKKSFVLASAFRAGAGNPPSPITNVSLPFDSALRASLRALDVLLTRPATSEPRSGESSGADDQD